MVKAYITVATYIGIIVWSIVGLIVWIPVLFYATSTFCLAVTVASLKGQPIDPDANIELKNKIDMYPRGFKNFELVLEKATKNAAD